MANLSTIANIASAIFGGASLLGGMGSSALSFFGSKKQFEWNKELQQRNFDFQERMANTEHQREIADLKTAGLNPIISATGGATTPSGGITSASMNDLGAGLSTGIANAKQLAMINTDIRKAKADINLTNKTAETEEIRKLNIEQNTALQNAQTTAQLIENSTLPQKLKNELKEQLSRIELNLASASAKQMDAISNRMNSVSNRMNAETNKQWTPVKVGGAIGAGLLGSFGLNGKGKIFKKIIKK